MTLGRGPTADSRESRAIHETFFLNPHSPLREEDPLMKLGIGLTCLAAVSMGAAPLPVRFEPTPDGAFALHHGNYPLAIDVRGVSAGELRLNLRGARPSAT